MAEFVLVLPIIFFVGALAVYLSRGLWIKEETQTTVRYELWHQARRSSVDLDRDSPDYHHDGWWHAGGRWSSMDPDANGPIGSGAHGGNRPRGIGDELRYFYENAGQDAHAASTNAQADDYFRRVWNNLPGRHHRRETVAFRTDAPALRTFNRDVSTDYYHDSVSWTNRQEPPWRIAQSGPMREIKEIFETHLAGVPDEFFRMKQEVLHAWFEERWLLNWENPDAPRPGGN